MTEERTGARGKHGALRSILEEPEVGMQGEQRALAAGAGRSGAGVWGAGEPTRAPQRHELQFRGAEAPPGRR